jgi:hypothetical protein
MAATGLPMVLHVIEIGRIVKGRRHSHWARIFRHPTVATFRFQHDDGKPLTAEGWKPAWFSDHNRNNATHWVDLMDVQGVNLIHKAPLKEIPERSRDEFVRGVVEEATGMKDIEADPLLISPCRDACHRFGKCKWLPVCFSLESVDIASLGAYRRK